MQTSATAAKLTSQDKPKTQLFSLKTPYMKQGRVTQLVAETANMWIHTKINAEGGENEIHKHMDEDHAFIVLEGQMSVFDENGGEIEVKQYQGVMIPKGAYYRYLNTGEGNLVVIRVGAGVKGQQQGGQEMRLGKDGKPLVSGTPENRNLPPIEAGTFFADSAG
ncbi:MAG TPA: cupin domain-containing protein [Candidatus Binatia bacterium]|jgi:mannose-6-phosphate isomerase-like protein (cupin superfamily)|nr:cupin domain-containing protein [Candidatus Binatia bacterium]